MNIWLILWIVLSFLLLVFFVWSNLTLLDQKKAWKAFAKKYTLKYYPNGFLKSPLVTHEFGNKTFRLFSEEQVTGDMAGRRFTTVFEWLMPAMPTKGIIASANLKAIVDLALVHQNIKNPPGEWDKKNYIKTDDTTVLLTYLTHERMDQIRNMINIKNTGFLFAFDEEQGVLRLETYDPLLTPKKVSSLFEKLKRCVEALEPRQEDFEKADAALSQIEDKKQEVEQATIAGSEGREDGSGNAGKENAPSDDDTYNNAENKDQPYLK